MPGAIANLGDRTRPISMPKTPANGPGRGDARGGTGEGSSRDEDGRLDLEEAGKRLDVLAVEPALAGQDRGDRRLGDARLGRHPGLGRLPGLDEMTEHLRVGE